MPGQSKKTERVSIRLPMELIAILRRRCAGGKPISEYIRERLEYDLTRQHNRKHKKNGENTSWR